MGEEPNQKTARKPVILYKSFNIIWYRPAAKPNQLIGVPTTPTLLLSPSSAQINKLLNSVWVEHKNGMSANNTKFSYYKNTVVCCE
jgi:hypothetical protein